MSTSFANHQALQGLGSEQIAELALLGLRCRALGAGLIDFTDTSMLDWEADGGECGEGCSEGRQSSLVARRF